MHVLVCLQNIRRLIKQIIKELRQQKSCSLVLLLRQLHLILEFQVILLQLLIFHLGPLQFLFNFVEFVLQEVD